MSIHIDLKYTNLLSHKFEKFARKDDYLFNVRCPLCGDSKKNKSKMRGYIYRKGNNLFYKCHNCNAGTSLGSLIKFIDSSLYKEYTLERYKAGESGNSNSKDPAFSISPPRFDKVEKSKLFEHAEWCDKLPSGHFCLEYLQKRKIPEQWYSKLLFTQHYKRFCDTLIPNHGKQLTDDARLIIPFYDVYNNLIAVSGRALETSDYKLRYVTLRTEDSNEKLVFGMDRVNLYEPVKIVEGPIDSLFLSNCIASGDANLSLTAKNISSSKKILIFDNEPRNKEIVKMIDVAIKSDNFIVIWPDTIEQKDINEMVMFGMSPDEIERIISSNTFTGLRAQMKFISWKKV
jgi:hypothetical protein